MATFEEIMQKYVNTDYDVLVSLAKTARDKVLPACRRVNPDNNGYMMLVSIVLAAVAADGDLTALERRFLRDVLELDDAGIDKLISVYDSKMADLVDKFADNMSQDVKADTSILLLTIMACDEKISREETAYIKKIFE